MKKLLQISLIILLGFFVSCSNEDESFLSADELIGVWEQEGFMDTSGQRLVFSSDQSGIQIFRTVYSEEEIVSSAHMISWEMEDDIVTVNQDNEVFRLYTINSEGQLISDNPEEIPFDKISDTTLNY